MVGQPRRRHKKVPLLQIDDLVLFPMGRAGYESHWHDCVKPFEEMHFLNGFGHADRRFHFRPDWAALGREFAAMPELPGYNPGYDHADAERPFRLVAAPATPFPNTPLPEPPGPPPRHHRPIPPLPPQAPPAPRHFQASALPLDTHPPPHVVPPQ